MAEQGSELVPFKRALYEKLKLAVPATTTVMYALTDEPDEYPDEAVWMGLSETEELAIPTMRAGKLHLQEKVRVYVYIQVMLLEGQEQYEADERAGEILGVLQTILSATPKISPDTQWARLISWKNVIGKAGTGHGARFVCEVEFNSRIE